MPRKAKKATRARKTRETDEQTTDGTEEQQLSDVGFPENTRLVPRGVDEPEVRASSIEGRRAKMERVQAQQSDAESGEETDGSESATEPAASDGEE